MREALGDPKLSDRLKDAQEDCARQNRLFSLMTQKIHECLSKRFGIFMKKRYSVRFFPNQELHKQFIKKLPCWQESVAKIRSFLGVSRVFDQ